MRTTNQLSSVLSGGRFALKVGVASAIEPGVVKFGLLAHTLEAPLTQQDLTPLTNDGITINTHEFRYTNL